MSTKKSVSEKAAVTLEPQTVEAMVELVDSIELLRSFFNDQVIHDISGILSSVLKLVNAISGTDLVDILERGLQDPELDRALMNPPKVGLWGLISALGNDDVQKGMGIIIELLKAIGRASGE